ncbi:hypothetical protein M1349_02725 [Patescibacteria group bacterium]|nr:hypothetical protein [Patescibacteria group bacterium]
MKTKIFLSVFFLALFLQVPKDKVFAACAGVPLSGNYTVTTSCAFQNTVDGVDAGTGASNSAVLTIGSGKTLTINAGQSVAFGLMSVGKPGGTIAINKTGQLVKKPLWAPNQDGDARPTTANPSLLAQSSQPANHSRRNVLTSLSIADCLDTDAAKWQNLDGYTDSDSDGYGVGAINAVGNRGTAGGAAGSGTSVTLTKQTGTTTGDLIIAVIQKYNTDAITAPDGWTVLESVNDPQNAGGTGMTAVYYKVATGSEPATYVFSWDARATAYYAGKIRTYYNFSSSPFVIEHSVATGWIQYTIDASSITTTFPDSLLVAVIGIDQNRTFSNWTNGFTEVMDSGTTNAATAIAEKVQATPGASGAVQAQANNMGNGAAILFSIRPSVTQTPSSICSGNSLPAGYASTGTDCMPADVAKYQTLTVYSDIDGDTYGAATGDYTITRRSSINKSSTTATGNFVLNKPTGTAQGDTLIAAIYAFSVYQVPAAASSIDAPAGWFQINTGSEYRVFSSYGRLSTFYKEAGGSEPASYTFNVSNAYAGTFYNIGYIASYYNATSSAVGPSSAAGNTFASSAITTASTNNMVISAHGGSNGSAEANACANNCWSSPSGMLRFVEQSYYKMGMSGFQMIQAAAGSTGTKTAAYTGTNGLTYSDVSIMFALKPYIGPSSAFVCAGASAPSGYSTNNTDCNPQNSAENTSCP